MGEAFEVMESIGLSAKDSADINNYFVTNQAQKDSQTEFNLLMGVVAPSYQEKIQEALFSTVVRGNSVAKQIIDGVEME